MWSPLNALFINTGLGVVVVVVAVTIGFAENTRQLDSAVYTFSRIEELVKLYFWPFNIV